MKRKIPQIITILLATVIALSMVSATNLHKMVEKKQYKKLRNLMFDDSIDPNIRNEEGKTPLQVAIELGYADIVDFLLSIKADPDATDNEGNSALFYAVIVNSVEMTQSLLNNQADINAQNKSGDTPLIKAVNKNKKKIIALLREKGADIFIKNSKGESAVTIAAQKGVQSLNLLVDDSNINQESEDGHTFLSVAIEAGLNKSVSHLLEMGADPKLGLIEGISNVEYSFRQSQKSNFAKIAIQLVEKGMEVPDSQFDYINYFVNSPKIAGFYSRGGFPLHKATAAGHKGFVKYFLDEGFDPNKKDEHALSCLNLAIENGNYLIARMLIDSKAEINSRTPQGDSPLMLLLKTDVDVKLATGLIKRGAEINIRNYWGASPLLLAIMNNYPVATIQSIISKGANITIRNNDGLTPLHAAIKRGDKQIISLFLDKNANINAIDNYGNTPFKMAIEKGSEFLSWFTDNINIMTKDDSGDSLLHIAISMDSDIDTIKLLLVKGIPLNQKNLSGDTPFIIALKRQNVEISKLLLDSGADLFIENKEKNTPMSIALAQPWKDNSWLLTDNFLKAKDHAGNTPLHWAVNAEKLDAALSLITLGADINVMNNFGRTPLHKAILKQDNNMIKLLFNYDVDTNIRDHAGNTAYHYIVYNNSTELLKLFEGKGMDLNGANIYGKTPLHEAVSRDAIEITKALLDQGADVHIRDNWGRTAAHDAAAAGNMKAMRALLRKNASYTTRDNGGQTPLHYAVKNNRKSVSRYLLNIGADIYAADKNGTTPIDMVLSDLTVMEWFIDGGIVNLPDNKGRYPLHIALEKKAPFEIILSLVEKGASLSTKDMRGETALHYAMRNRDYESAKMFIDHNANIFALNKDGDSPLSLASKESEEVLNWFINSQNLNSTDNQGNTALHIAAIERNTILYDYLIKRGISDSIVNKDGYSAKQLLQM